MNDSKLVPSFRFVEFKEGYTKNNLKELASFLKGKGYSKNDIVNYGFPIILYGRMYTNYRLNIKFINDTFVKNDKNSVKSVEGDVIIPASGETAEDISIASNIKRSGIIIGGDINIIRPDNKLIDSSFLALVLSNGKVKQQIAKRAQGKSIVHIHNTDLMSLKIYFPSLNEQQKIGDFFTKLDKLLDLQQQKIDKLELLKKAFLQKLFPKHDAQIPEFRFKGCNGEWEDCLVGNLLEVVPNKKYITEASKKGLNPVIQQGEKPILGFSNKAPYKEYKKVVLFGDHTLSLYKPKSPFLIATDGIKILYVKDWNGYFLFAFLQKYKPDSEGYKRHFSILKSKKAKFTVIDEEQQKIGNLLSEVDQLIELENQKLQNFQQVKKCLLQNMFVE